LILIIAQRQIGTSFIAWLLRLGRARYYGHPLAGIGSDSSSGESESEVCRATVSQVVLTPRFQTELHSPLWKQLKSLPPVKHLSDLSLFFLCRALLSAEYLWKHDRIHVVCSCPFSRTPKMVSNAAPRIMLQRRNENGRGEARRGRSSVKRKPDAGRLPQQALRPASANAIIARALQAGRSP
jgi:hypothetical protein